ncbi:MAG TPA: cysteine dioxygenase family protein [Acidimicrobiales bacterium]|nr:cysteine dioxygenase family protein [Acidimicrobiales bacterium]
MTVLIQTPGTLDSRELAALARRLGSAVRGDEVTIERGEDRGFVRLLETPTHEAWLIAWARTSGLDLHDHGGSAGAIHVVRGRLHEEYTDLDRPHHLRSRRLGPGRSVPVPASRAHEVTNPGTELALSVHVYSPPITTMTFYDRDPERFLKRLRTEPR